MTRTERQGGQFVLTETLREGYTALREMGAIDPADFFARLRALRDVSTQEKKRLAISLAEWLERLERKPLAAKLRQSCHGPEFKPPGSNKIVAALRSQKEVEPRWYALRTREDFTAFGLRPTFYRFG